MSGASQRQVTSGECEFITVPNTLAHKVGPDFRAAAAKALGKAEDALKKLSANFGEWLEQEVVALEEARAAIRASGLDAMNATALATRALDLKGLGATYDHPLVARIGGSLFKLMDETPFAQVPLSLIDAHVDAARAIVRGGIRDPAHPVCSALVQELDRRIQELAAARAVA